MSGPAHVSKALLCLLQINLVGRHLSLYLLLCSRVVLLPALSSSLLFLNTAMNKGQLTWKPQGLKPRKSAGVNTQPDPGASAPSRIQRPSLGGSTSGLTSLYLSDLVF